MSPPVPEPIALPTRRATKRLARALAPWLTVGDMLLLAGDLGAGKTFFVRALCRCLGVPEHVRVTSPSFALIHEIHQGRLTITHADLYRIDTAEDVLRLGLRERRADSLVVVEWGAPFESALGGDAIHLELMVDVSGRRVRLGTTGPASSERLRRAAVALERVG